MIRLIFSLLTLLTLAAAHAQPAEKIFREVASRLDALSSLQYDSYREINNYKDNYFSKNSGSCYFEFDSKAEGKLARFQFKSDQSRQVYNGTEYFTLNEKDKTYEFAKRNASSLSNLSLLFNSIATLRISLPVIANDNSVPKSVNDTLIENRNCYLLKFQLYKKTLEFPAGFSGFDIDITRYYELIVDKKTLLPYIIIDGNSLLKEQYFTKTIFTSVVTNPQKPKESSWFFSDYSGYSPKKDTRQNPIVQVGDTMPDWSLPQYGNEGVAVNQTAYKGKKVLVEFWIKNCSYCMQAFPDMKELQERYGKNVEIVSVNAYDEPEAIEFFYKREKPAYKMLYNGEKLANKLGIYGFPTVLLIDETGKIVYAHVGFNKKEIESLLLQK